MSGDERAELARLRAEDAELRMERDVLKVTGEAGARKGHGHCHQPRPYRPAPLFAAANHPFWVNDNASWLHVGRLQNGDELRVTGAGHGEVLHAYHVLARDTAVLVHNCGGAYPREFLDRAKSTERAVFGNCLTAAFASMRLSQRLSVESAVFEMGEDEEVS